MKGRGQGSIKTRKRERGKEREEGNRTNEGEEKENMS